MAERQGNPMAQRQDMLPTGRTDASPAASEGTGPTAAWSALVKSRSAGYGALLLLLVAGLYMGLQNPYMTPGVDSEVCLTGEGAVEVEVPKVQGWPTHALPAAQPEGRLK